MLVKETEVENVSETEARYRPIPFWSWNDKIEPQECRRQVRLMQEAGMGGFFMHARGGLETEYMSEKWFEAVSACVEEAEKCGLDAWVYDENGWPSGAADGKVCKGGIEYQQKKLKCEKGNGCTPYTIANINGYHFYYEVNPHYIDVLNKKAVASFIEYTHKPYYERYGNRIKGFFTDEPQLAMGEYPWSFELVTAYSEKYAEDLTELLYDLFFETDTSRRTRINFWRLVCDMFSESFFRQIYEWCDERGLMLTGHLLAEESIASQIATSGSVMPHYEYFHMPGVDFLGRGKDRALVPLQVSSVASQLGKPQILTESFAMCGHGIRFDELKSIAEVQMVRGVTTICQHLQGYTMRGIRKRDYPPALFYQQPWWEYYDKFNNSLSQVGKVLAEGEIICDTLLIVPMTEAWARYDGTQNERLREVSNSFAATVKELEGKHILFHLGDESILRRYAQADNGSLTVGKQCYNRVLVCGGCEYSDETKELLKRYVESGGTVEDPEQTKNESIADNPAILYTKRRIENKDTYYFVNQTDSEQTVQIVIGNMKKTYTFAPYESRLLPPENTEKPTGKPLPLDGIWRIKYASENSLVLDFCDYYFDGELIEKNGYILNIQKRACELERPIDIRCEFSVEIKYIPEGLYLVCETPEKLYIEVNGKSINKTDCGFFADSSFRKLDISEYAVLGNNKIVISTYFTQ